jgi:hypothetical protein
MILEEGPRGRSLGQFRLIFDATRKKNLKRCLALEITDSFRQKEELEPAEMMTIRHAF